MESKKTLCVGLDLCDDITQLSCYNERTFEPEIIRRNENGTFIPSVLAVKEDTREWFFGEEAMEAVRRGEAVLIDHFVSKIIGKKAIEVCESVLDDILVMEKFLRKTISLLKKYYPNESILKITVTVPDMDRSLIEAVYGALNRMGILKDRAQVIGHEQAYLYYALSQKKELWMNDIGLFEFNEKGLFYHQISINRRTMPMAVGVSHKDFSQTLSYELLLENRESGGVDYVFDNIAKNVLYKQIVSTLYLTGKGFDGGWADQVLKELCAGRRLFVGQNLFCSGACYASKETASLLTTGEGKLKDFIFLSAEMVPCTLSMKVYYNANIEEVILVKAGIPWYEVDTKIAVIADHEEEMEIIVRDVMRRTAAAHLISLNEIAGRPARTTRLELSVRFEDAKTAIITVRDKGFGELYPTSSRIWEKMIRL